MSTGPSIGFTRWFLRFLGAVFAVGAFFVAREPESATEIALPFCVVLALLFLGVGFFGTDRWVERLGRLLHW